MNILRIDREIVDETIEVKEDETQSFNLAAFRDIQPAKIVLNLRKNAVFDMNFADFGNWEGVMKIVVNLLEEGASFRFHCASYSSEKQKKFISVDVNHKAKNTESLVSCYGIASEVSEIHFDGCSSIDNGAKGSKTRQEAKAILFDEKSQGYCSPVLKIDENDVAASHAASVGRVNDDHLYYLLSRGLTPRDARRVIVMGYLKPIADYFEGEEMKKRILDVIEERV